MFTMELILIILDLDKKIQIEVDMSNYVVKGVLSMKHADRR